MNSMVTSRMLVLPHYRRMTQNSLVVRRHTRNLSASSSSPLSSSTSSPTFTNNTPKDPHGGENITVLYKRDESRNSLPRASFAVSSGNLLYWIWYVFDFVPAVNTSTVADLHVDPAYGFGGLGVSLLIHSMFTLYPLSLISQLAYKPTTSSSPSGSQQGQILVWKHTLPMVNASKSPTIASLGSITMDKASPDTAKILNEYNGNLKQFQGHLAVAGAGYFPLLMEIQKPSEVLNSQLLLEVLLDPQRLRQENDGSEKKSSKGKKSRRGGRRRGKQR